MQRSVANQKVVAQMCIVGTDDPFTGTVTVFFIGDGGTLIVGETDSGVAVHKGSGLHVYTPSIFETGYDHAAFQFRGTGAKTIVRDFYTVLDCQVVGANGTGNTAIAEAVWHRNYPTGLDLPEPNSWEEALKNFIESLGSGTGSRTVTITVNDGATVLQNALVRMTEGVNTHAVLTNASGVAVFNLDDATWTVSITKAGYSYAGTTLLVDGTEAETYSMTAVVITPPANPDLSALEVLCVDELGEPQAGVEIDIRIITIPSGDTNIAYKGSKQTATSGIDGIARLEAVKEGVYEYKRGLAQVWERVTIGSGSSTSITSFIGSP